MAQTQATAERPSVEEVQSMDDPARASSLLLAAVLLLSASGLLFELTLVRIFSATIWYHYTFVAISVALFGWGLGGFLVFVLGLGRSRDIAPRLVLLCLLLAAALPAVPILILQFPLTPYLLPLYFGLSLVPFLVGGAALSLVFERASRDINRLYFADLAGAAAGVLAVPAALAALGAETAMMAIAVLPALAALLLTFLPAAQAGRLRGAAALVLAAVAALSWWNIETQAFTIRNAPEKALYKLLEDRPGARVVFDRWNAYSRITAVVGFDETHVARLFIDSDAETSVPRWGGLEPPAGAADYFRAFPFRLVPEPRVLVIGPGGGADVACAVAAGSPRVTAVEMNPLIIEAVRQFGDEAGNIYGRPEGERADPPRPGIDVHPRVRLVQEEGRNFVQRSGDVFDLVVLGFVDSWAAVASGGLSLTENYLYTTGAMQAYFDRLSEGGGLAVIRWPVDLPRLVANAVAVLGNAGMPIEEIGRHILAVCREEPRGIEPVETVFLLTRSPMSPATVDRLLAGFPGAHVAWAPHRPSQEPYAGLFRGSISFAEYTDSFATMATPVNDDRPFYFAWDKPAGIPPFAVQLLSAPVLAALLFCVLLLLAAKKRRLRPPGPAALIYFSMLGAGFIITEVALMQRLILLLGHTVYTLVVILFTLLLSGALGSLYARRIPAGRIRRALGVILPLILLLILAAGFLLPALVQAALPLELAARIAVAAAAVAPLGFLMGMPFPLALRRAAADARGAPVSALWGVNGVASVIGSIGGVLLAISAGFTAVFIAGAACYGAAWAARGRR